MAIVSFKNAADGNGYIGLGQDGGIFIQASAGSLPFKGSIPANNFSATGGVPISDAAAVAVSPDGSGYWIVRNSGGGDIYNYGPIYEGGGTLLGAVKDITAMRNAPNNGYWILDDGGNVDALGLAAYHGGGSIFGAVAIVSSLSGGGYWIVTFDGHVYNFGDAPSLADVSGPTNIVGAVESPDGNGLLICGADGGVFAVGSADFINSLPGESVTPSAPIVGIARSGDGGGYVLGGSDGNVYAFGDSVFRGAL